MKRPLLFSIFGIVSCLSLSGQTNIHFTNPQILNILKGNYEAQMYLPSEIIDNPIVISNALTQKVSPDSLKAILLALETFHNRNTASDTLSESDGIGAARSWVLAQFDRYSSEEGGRLVTGYLQFDQDICTMSSHKNIVGVLPGRNVEDPSSIVIEAHLDSRCADNCSIDCLTQGMEDNGSGVALVLELARIMSHYVFNHTIVFMATTGEEQGLYGGYAYALYAKQEVIPIKAVLNNDIVGGIICGETSSPPSCPGLNNIDSTQVRLFSYGGFNSPHKSLSRYIKLEYNDMMKAQAKVPMTISIMSAEDRTGRGGDHIPFRENDFTAMRFTSANEHGDANVTDPNYHDRQHTSDDILGVDTNGDSEIDSFFVDFDYLARNVAINGNAAAMAALGPEAPSISSVSQNGDFLYIQIEDSLDYNHYVVGLRVSFNDFDTLYYINDSKSGTFRLPKRNLNIFISAASIDSDGVESLFSEEKLVRLTTGIHDQEMATNAIELLQNKPNPADESTIISFLVNEPASVRHAKIVITDLLGKKIKEIPVDAKEGMNEVLFNHGYNMTGTYLYSLFVENKLIATKKLVFEN